MPGVNRTLVIVKPDAVERGLVGEVLARLERRQLRLVAAELRLIDLATARRHYAEHEGKPFFAGLVDYITATPVVALVVEGHDAIEGCRATNGATNPIKATPGTVRGDFGQTVGRNLVHASDSPAAAEREVAIFFHDAELFTRAHALAAWLAE